MRRAWTPEDEAALRDVYASAKSSRQLGLQELAVRLGRSMASVHVRASRLGLGDFSRPKTGHPKGPKPRKFATAEELRLHQSKTRREWMATHEHPRGYAGHSHGAEVRKKISAKSRAAWLRPESGHNSEQRRQKMSDAFVGRKNMRSGYNRSAGGRRPDLGNVYFRSSWEANYARYLNRLLATGKITDWAYEPHTFVFEAIKRGTRSYTPDFRVGVGVGVGVEWHEVKGWMDKKSRTRLARMARYFPNEVIKVLDAKWFRAAQRSGLADSIHGWEHGGKRSPVSTVFSPSYVPPRKDICPPREATKSNEDETLAVGRIEGRTT